MSLIMFRPLALGFNYDLPPKTLPQPSCADVGLWHFLEVSSALNRRPEGDGLMPSWISVVS
jgi:hypothetical protein